MLLFIAYSAFENLFIRILRRVIPFEANILNFLIISPTYPQTLEDDGPPRSSRGMREALCIPQVALATFSILCASSSIGFLLTALEPHLRQFELSPLQMGGFPRFPVKLASVFNLEVK